MKQFKAVVRWVLSGLSFLFFLAGSMCFLYVHDELHQINFMEELIGIIVCAWVGISMDFWVQEKLG